MLKNLKKIRNSREHVGHPKKSKCWKKFKPMNLWVKIIEKQPPAACGRRQLALRANRGSSDPWRLRPEKIFWPTNKKIPHSFSHFPEIESLFFRHTFDPQKNKRFTLGRGKCIGKKRKSLNIVFLKIFGLNFCTVNYDSPVRVI